MADCSSGREPWTRGGQSGQSGRQDVDQAAASRDRVVRRLGTSRGGGEDLPHSATTEERPRTDPEIPSVVREAPATVEPGTTTNVGPSEGAAAARSGLRPSHLLLVHLGQEERECIDEDLFHELVDKMEKRILADPSDEGLHLQCSFTRWAGGQGLFGCLDEGTAEYVSRLVSEIRIGGKSFKTWTPVDDGSLDGLTFDTPDFPDSPDETDDDETDDDETDDDETDDDETHEMTTRRPTKRPTRRPTGRQTR